MPLIQIDLDRRLFDEKASEVSAAIHQAQIDALGIPAHDKFQVFRPFDDGADPLRFNPSYDGRPSQMIVQITMVRRYSVAVKTDLFKGILLKLAQLGIDPDDVHIPIVENGFEDWFAGMRG